MTYRYVKLRISKSKTRDEHRVKMEKKLGRKLRYNEVIDHKNGDKKDNRLSNLRLMNRSQHNRMHINKGDFFK